MKSNIAYLLLSTAIATPAFGGGPTNATGPIGSVVTAGSVAVVQPANTQLFKAVSSAEQPTQDCCYDSVILDREAPAPRAARGPSCCWDESIWD